MPGIVRGQVQGGDLFATVNLGGTFNNGASPIYRYTPDGSSSIFASALDTPRGLAFDGAGNLYVAANTNLDPSLDLPPVQGTILKITPGGFMSTFATGFPVSFLQGLATDSDRNVFVTAQVDATTNAPSTIYKITPDGTLSSFASLSATGWALAFDSAGNLYAAATDSNGNGEILRFAPDGTPDSSPFVGPAVFPSGGPFPIGLAFDAFGNLFASTINGNDSTGDIRKFGPDGTEITPRFATGLTKGPRGLVFDGGGNLFVAEIGIPGSDIIGDILEFTPGGTQSVFSSQGFGFRGNRGPEWLAFTTGAVTPPSSAVTLTFPDATTPLTTTVTSVDYNSVPLPPSNFELETGSNLAFEITATTEPTPPIIIAFTVPASVYTPTLKALHYENGNWVDSTIYPADPNYPSNPAPNTVYASVNSLSPFLVARFRYAAQVQQPINANGTSVFNVRRGVIPLKFTLTNDGSSTCTLPPATIAVTRTAGGTTGAINESVYSGSADNSSNFRIASCQYVYNLNSSALGAGTYRVDAKVNGTVVGSATFQLK
jgi:sugar lactone lactonase YvrE